MKIKTIRFNQAMPNGIGVQFDDSDAQNIDVQMLEHVVIVEADRPALPAVPTSHIKIHVPWSQIMYVREK